MKIRNPVWLFLLLCFFATVLPGKAQLQPGQNDPLARIREAAKSNLQACLATGESLCEQVAPKIVANAEGDSPLEADLRRLAEAEMSDAHSAHAEWPATLWAVAAFRDANVAVQVEKYPFHAPPSWPQEREDVVAEIRGREKPDEWVLLGAAAANLKHCQNGAYNAASVIEAARAIQLTGIHPRRSIRFVLFDGGSSFPYVQAHRGELDRTSAAIILCAAANPVTGFMLNGRHDIEPGVREALEPIYAMGITHHGFDAPFERDSLFFLLEGIPTLLTPPAEWTEHASMGDLAKLSSPGKAEIGKLKRNIAIAAVAAFGIAERAAPLGPRQSRTEIESLLKASGLDEQMKSADLWSLWKSGEIGRLP